MPHSTSPFFEVQGLALCPADDHPNEHCSVPDEGEWHTLFHLLTSGDGVGTLALVMESDSPMYDRFEDFRMVAPIEKRRERFVSHEGYPWERGTKTARSRRPVEAVVVPLITGKKKRKVKAS